jgi:hypothetical protein
MNTIATALHENFTTSKTESSLKNEMHPEHDGQSVCACIDAETAMLLEEIRARYSSETHASIIAKAIRRLHDMTCRTLIRAGNSELSGQV